MGLRSQNDNKGNKDAFPSRRYNSVIEERGESVTIERDIAEYRLMCGKTLGIVLATGPESTYEVALKQGARPKSIVCEVVNAACWAQVAYVFLVAAPLVGEEVTRLVHLEKRSRNAPLVQAVECELNALYATRDASNLEVVDALLDAAPVDCDSAIVMHADHPLVTADQIYDLCEKAKRGWDEQTRIFGQGLPYFVTKD